MSVLIDQAPQWTLGVHKPFALSVTDGGTQLIVECALIVKHEAGLKIEVTAVVLKQS